MKTSKPPSIRDIAQNSGYSVATVSEALRNSPRVKPETREVIIEVAHDLGYKSNFLVGNVMSHLRRSQANSFRGVIAVIETATFAERRKTSPWHRELFEACIEQCERLGYKLSFFKYEEPLKSVKRLDNMLWHRGVKAILVPPFISAKDLSLLNWNRYCGIQLDYGLKNLRLNTVCPDHHLTMIKLLRELRERGYKRPGVALEEGKDRRIMMKWYGAYMSFHKMRDEVPPVPMLLEPSLEPKPFFGWLEAHKPDVVIGHRACILDWLRESKLNVPEDVGFCSLNMHDCRVESAGMNLQPAEIGRIAIKNLVALIFQQDLGIPTTPQTITVQGRWVDGPTIRSSVNC